MKIKRCPLVFHNVISMTIDCNDSALNEELLKFKYAIIRNEFFPMGPVIYKIEELDEASNRYTFFIPIDRKVNLVESETFHFEEILEFKDGLSIRHADLDESLDASYEFLKVVEKSSNIILKEPFYNIYLEVYGGGVIDVYAPIENAGVLIND